MAPTRIDISVIVPCRNEEKHISKTIRHLLAQEGAKEIFTFELLIIDGRSIDGTVRLVEEQRCKHPGITLISNEKKTTPAAYTTWARLLKASRWP